MKLIKRIAAVIISGAAALSCYTFSSAAEEDIDGDADVIDTEDEASEDSDRHREFHTLPLLLTF